ncbi:MAG TPA: TusE/DsrC/DsvC family sulfur relay protein [candidate division Zixibacteria bacterium]|nr:TusE/DsrC/DsvC family sulfur relay protein [candidate division Zixibacteria bacterium]
MLSYTINGKEYKIDENNFLLDFRKWDEGFAVGMAEKIGMVKGLSGEHWDVIKYIRKNFETTGRCPLVYETCRNCGLTLKQLKRLFPTGYLRGACRLAGITYKEGYLSESSLPKTADDLNVISASKTYRVDVRGFLINPDDWDEYYAAHRAYDAKIPGGFLTEQHWKIINYLRMHFRETSEIPTVIQTCEDNKIDLSDLEALFPDGYHRGAVKISGLRVR